MNTSESFDVSPLVEIYELDVDTYFLVIDTYLEEMPENLQTIEDAIAAGDPDALMKGAHKLKGSSLTLGVNGLGDICKELEHIGRSHSMDGAQAAWDKLCAEIDTAKTDLTCMHDSPPV